MIDLVKEVLITVQEQVQKDGKASIWNGKYSLEKNE